MLLLALLSWANPLLSRDKSCFRAFSLGSSYSYSLTSDISLGRTLYSGATPAKSSTTALKLDLSAKIEPVALDSSGMLHVKLSIDHAHLLDEHGWQGYATGPVDVGAADAQLLEVLQGDFYYSQHCDMSIDKVHYPLSDEPFAINLKMGIARSFAGKLASHARLDGMAKRGAPLRYSHTEVDDLGEARVEYSHDVPYSASSVVAVKRTLDSARTVPMQKFRGLPPHQRTTEMDTMEKRESIYSSGVLQSLDSTAKYTFPSQRTLDPMKEEWEAAKREAERRAGDPALNQGEMPYNEQRLSSSAQGVELSWSVATRGWLTSVSSRPMAAADKRAIGSFRRDYLVKRHGAAAEEEFVSAPPLVLPGHAGGMFDAREDEHTLDELVDMLEQAVEQEEEAEHEEGDGSAEGSPHDAHDPMDLMGTQYHGDDAHEHYGNSRPSHYWAFSELGRRLRLEPAATAAELAKFLVPGSEMWYSETVRHSIINALAEWGGPEAQLLILDLARDEDQDYNTRHVAYVALSELSSPTRALTDDIEGQISQVTSLSEDKLLPHLLLCYGSMASSVHHEGQVQRAHDMREFLFAVYTQRCHTPDEQALLVFALQNSMKYVSIEDPALRNVTMGKHIDLSQVVPFFSPDPEDWLDTDVERRKLVQENLHLAEDLIRQSPMRGFDSSYHQQDNAATGGSLHKRSGGSKGDRSRGNGWSSWLDLSSYKIQSLSDGTPDGSTNTAANAFSQCLPNCPTWSSDKQTWAEEAMNGATSSGFQCEGPACSVFNDKPMSSGPATAPAEGSDTMTGTGGGTMGQDPNLDEDGKDSEGNKYKPPFLEECTPIWGLGSQQGSYKGKPCSYYFYDNWVPRNPKTEKKMKLGASKFYGLLEVALHGKTEGGSSRYGSYFALEFFVGGQFSVNLMSRKIPIVAAYVRANLTISSERDRCSYFSFGIMYMYFNTMYVFAIGDGQCQYVDSTCKPWMPYDHDDFGKLVLAKIVFFSWQTMFMVGPVPCVVVIEGLGEAAVYFDLRMIFSPPYYVDREGNVLDYCSDPMGRCSEIGSIDFGGGSAVNGIVEPAMGVLLAANFGVGIPVFSIGLGIEVTIIEVSLPKSIGLNFVTQEPCTGAAIRVGALGGRFYIWVQIGICKGWIKLCFRFEKTIYEWSGLSWECPLYMKVCCKECPGACNNAWCNYKEGQCVCNDHWGGQLCNMECPAGCDWNQAPLSTSRGGEPNPGVKCEVNPDASAFTDFCECYYGFFGWNCLVPCPGMIYEPGLPPKPCNDHGECGDYGYQRSDGFGSYTLEGEEDLAPLVGVCKCDENYFKDDCSITCPIDPDTGKACRNGGRCVFDGEAAFCLCLKGYAGPDCSAQCPLFRGSPCGYRGDCVWEDGDAKCHCHFGFSGEGCEIPSNRGSGRALRFEGSTWRVELTDVGRVSSESDRYTMGFWFYVEAQVETRATLMQWRHGRLILEPGGNLMFCDGRDNNMMSGCVPSGLNPVPVGQWQFVYAASESFQLAHDKRIFHGIPASSGCPTGEDITLEDGWCVYSGYEHENAELPTVAGHMIIGDGLYGMMDNIMVYSASGGLPTKTDVLDFAHNVLVPDEDGLLLYFLCDEGRGRVVYDEVNLLAARFEWADPEYDWVARGPDAIWANPSGVQLNSGSVYTNTSDVIELGGVRNPTGSRTECFHVDLAGLRIQEAELRFHYAVSTDLLCPISVEFQPDGTDLTVMSEAGDGSAKLYNGAAEEVIPLPVGVVQQLRSLNCFTFTVGSNAVEGDAECDIALDEAFLDVITPASDGYMEFTGRPESFVYTDNHPSLSGEFTIEMWLIRPPLLHSQRGLLLSLVDKGLDAAVSTVDGPFLLYETGFPEFGLQYQYEGQAEKVEVGGWDVPFRYTVPTDEWVHFSVSVRPSPSMSGKCEHRFTINGETDKTDVLSSVGSRDGAGELIQYPGPYEQLSLGDKPNHCTPGGVLAGWGDSGFRLRIGSKFLGAVNDVVIHDSYIALDTLRRSMFMHRDWSSVPGTLLAYDFEVITAIPDPNSDGKVQPVQVRDQSGNNYHGIMTDGAHAGVSLAVPHNWNHCPGCTYQTPESVCGSEPTHSHGECKMPRSAQDERTPKMRNVAQNPEIRTHTHSCECDAGYKLGFDKTCSIECPPSWQNPCSGHGTCVASQSTVPLTNGTDENIVDDTDAGTLVECLCDEGYVGASCEFECPGWTAVWNNPRRVCAGFGTCSATVDSAYCVCFDTSQRYGDACEFVYGNEPDEIVSQCGPCNDLGEVCVDNQCICRPGYYRTFGTCLPVGETLEEHPSNMPASIATTASLVAVVVIFGGCLYTVYAIKYKPVK